MRGETLDKAGLLLDFKDLKQVMRPVVDRLDHQMINDLEPFTEINPSAENLARYFFDETNRQLDEMTAGRVRVKVNLRLHHLLRDRHHFGTGSITSSRRLTAVLPVQPGASCIS